MEIVDNLRRRWKNLRSNFWPWLCRASGFGWGLLGVFAALAIGLLSHSAHADALVLAGTLLQVAAVIVLAVRLGCLQKHFGATPWWQKPIQWLKDFPFKVPQGRTITAEFGGYATAGGSASLREGIPEDLEKRIARLERMTDKLENRLDEVRSELKDEISSLEEDIQEERSRREQQIQRLKSSVERVSIGDLKWEGVALGWLLIGPLLSGEAEVLAKLVEMTF